MELRTYSVAKGSALCESRDPITGDFFKPGDQIVLCPRCRTPHLVESWQYNRNRCSTLGCVGNGSVRPMTAEQPSAISTVLSHISPVVMSTSALERSRQSPVHIIAHVLQGIYAIGHTLIVGLTIVVLATVFLVDLCGGMPGLPEITILLGLAIGCVIAMLVAVWFAMYLGYSLWCKALEVEPIPAIDLVDPDEYQTLVVLGGIGAALIGLLSILFVGSQ